MKPDERYERMARETDWGHEFIQWSPNHNAYYCDCGQINGAGGQVEPCPIKIALALERAAVEGAIALCERGCRKTCSTNCIEEVNGHVLGNGEVWGLCKVPFLRGELAALRKRLEELGK